MYLKNVVSPNAVASGGGAPEHPANWEKLLEKSSLILQSI